MLPGMELVHGEEAKLVLAPRIDWRGKIIPRQQVGWPEFTGWGSHLKAKISAAELPVPSQQSGLFWMCVWVARSSCVCVNCTGKILVLLKLELE